MQALQQKREYTVAVLDPAGNVTAIVCSDVPAAERARVAAQILRLPGDNMRILVEGQYRAKLLDMIHSEPHLFGRVVELDEPGYRHDPLRLQALIRQGHELFGQIVDLAV